MKLNESKPYLEVSGELEEQFFSIQDIGAIFDILRNKMYSNPILAICREISCNARDAHREVGKGEAAIQIHLPNQIEPYFKVKDFGPGISPDRMSNIFIKYTASTKRSDNLQTGGFGLGAKTPFSYSDSFSIVTNVDGIRYNYSCNIDETKVGKLSLMSESPTTEPNGTEIQIPVLAKNFNEFATWTEQACRHWDVKPIIKGGDGAFAWQKINKTLEGSNWAIFSSTEYYNRECKMVIDGIEYPLDLDVLKKYADGQLIDSARGKFIMYFGVGELSLSANREQIYLDEKTQNVIRERLKTIQDEIKQKVADKIESFSNLWEASIYYRKELKQAFNNVVFLGKQTWHGYEVNDDYVYTDCPVYAFVKGKYAHRRKSDPNKLHRSLGSHLAFEETGELYVNDLPLKEPTPRHVKKAFDSNPKLTTLWVVCPTDKVPLTTLNAKIHLDQMAPKMLSDITKATSRTYTPAASRLIIFKYDKRAGAFRQVSYASLEEDLNSKTICSLAKDSYPANTRHVTLKNNKRLDMRAVKTLADKFEKFSFYGVDEDTPADRIEEEFSDFEDIEDFIQENVLDSKTIDYLQIKFAATHNSQSSFDSRLNQSDKKLDKLINNPNSLYLKRASLQKRIRELSVSNLDLLRMYEALNGDIGGDDMIQYVKDHPEFDIDSLNEEYKKQYPLLEHIQTYNVQDIVEHIAHYVNLADKGMEEKNV